MRKRLATPGPTEVPQNLLLAGAQEIIHHRSPAMRDLVDEINVHLPDVFRTASDVYTIVASGTGAMEAAVANLFAPGETVLVVTNGYFGERFADIARAYRLGVVEIRSAWGTSIDMEHVRQARDAHGDAAGILVVHSETSTGALNDIQAIGELFRESDAVVVVDSISGLISHPLEMDGWGLDVVLGASHKAFMLPPGLAFIALSDRAWARADRVTPTAYYWSFARLRKFHPMPPSSPAVSLQAALLPALRMITEEGLPAIQERQRSIGDAALAALIELGFTPFIRAPHERNYIVTAVLSPDGVNSKDLVRALRDDWGITVTGGQGDYADTLLRVGHVGAVDRLDAAAIIGGIEIALTHLGHEGVPGRGAARFIRALAEEDRS
jgi:aspartate aminotransferase-like enzyme